MVTMLRTKKSEVGRYVSNIDNYGFMIRQLVTVRRLSAACYLLPGIPWRMSSARAGVGAFKFELLLASHVVRIYGGVNAILLIARTKRLHDMYPELSLSLLLLRLALIQLLTYHSSRTNPAQITHRQLRKLHLPSHHPTKCIRKEAATLSTLAPQVPMAPLYPAVCSVTPPTTLADNAPSTQFLSSRVVGR